MLRTPWSSTRGSARGVPGIQIRGDGKHDRRFPSRPVAGLPSTRVMRRCLTIAAALLAAAVASAQRLPDIPAPTDLAAPPAEAVRSPSGLISRTVTPGTGTETPQDTDFVTVHYTGWTSEGRLFDSSYARNMPSMFALNRVMAGWRECVLLMKVGETRRCWVPQDLAFKGQPGRPG